MALNILVQKIGFLKTTKYVRNFNFKMYTFLMYMSAISMTTIDRTKWYYYYVTVCEDTNHQCPYLIQTFNLCNDVKAAVTVGCTASCGLCRKYTHL
jgi:hypothetical protein